MLEDSGKQIHDMTRGEPLWMMHMASSSKARAAFRACYRKLRVQRKGAEQAPHAAQRAQPYETTPLKLPILLRFRIWRAASLALKANDYRPPSAGRIERLMRLRKVWAELEAPKNALNKAICTTVNALSRKEVLACSRDKELTGHLVELARLRRIRSSQQPASGRRGRAAGSYRRAGNDR